MKDIILLRKILFLAVLTVIFAGAIFSNTDPLPPVTIKKIPVNIDEFISLRDEISSTPEGGATVMITALIIYTRDSTLGLQCLTIAVDKERLVNGNAYKGYSLNKSDLGLIEQQIGEPRGKSYIPYSYIKGTKIDDLYKLPPGDITFEFLYNKYSGNREGDKFKVFVRCSGADTPRPITLMKNDKGIWKASEWSSLLVGVKKPKEKDEL